MLGRACLLHEARLTVTATHGRTDFLIFDQVGIVHYPLLAIRILLTQLTSDDACLIPRRRCTPAVDSSSSSLETRGDFAVHHTVHTAVEWEPARLDLHPHVEMETLVSFPLAIRLRLPQILRHRLIASYSDSAYTASYALGPCQQMSEPFTFKRILVSEQRFPNGLSHRHRKLCQKVHISLNFDEVFGRHEMLAKPPYKRCEYWMPPFKVSSRFLHGGVTKEVFIGYTGFRERCDGSRLRATLRPLVEQIEVARHSESYVESGLRKA